jgi:integrase/recombinase XerD
VHSSSSVAEAEGEGVVKLSKGGRPKLRPFPLEAGTDRMGMRAQMLEYVLQLRVRHFSEHTVHNRAQHLATFADWAAERALLRPAEITPAILERYQRHLFHYRKKNGKPLGTGTQHALLCSVKLCFRWLTRQRRIPYNPAAELELPKVEKRLPKAVLTLSEAERVMQQPDLRTPLGIRDRAVLETLFSTGVRRAAGAG